MNKHEFWHLPSQAPDFLANTSPHTPTYPLSHVCVYVSGANITHVKRCKTNNLHGFLWKCLSNLWYTAATAKSLQSCPTLCDPRDGSPPRSPVPGILQARTLEWVAISFSNAGKWKVKVKSLSGVRLFASPWTAAYQAPPAMGFSRQEYWSGLPLPSPCMYITYFIYPFICLWILELLLPLVIVKMVQWSLIY